MVWLAWLQMKAVCCGAVEVLKKLMIYGASGSCQAQNSLTAMSAEGLDTMGLHGREQGLNGSEGRRNAGDMFLASACCVLTVRLLTDTHDSCRDP